MYIPAAPGLAFIVVAGPLLIVVSHSSAATLSTLFSFDSATGSFSQGHLLIDSNKALFGTSTDGGLFDAGTVFKFDTLTNTHEILVSFSYTNGSVPVGDLIKDAEGNLYGTTASGGPQAEFPFQGVGTAFKLDASNGYSLSTIVDFDPTGIIHPNGGLIADSEGNFYGTATGDYPREGTVFKLDVSHNYEPTVLTRFYYDTSEAGLHSDAEGNLYGITQGSDEYPFGSVYKLDKSNNYSRSILSAFTGVDGEYQWPNGHLISDAAGNLFGTTGRGGANNLGTVFMIDALNNYTIIPIVNFSGENGANPVGGLIADAAGNLFGATLSGGTGHGTAFKLDAADSFRLVTLVTFDGKNGSGPFAGLSVDSSGNLFGRTSSGGAHDRGTIFKIEGAGFVLPEPSSKVLLCILACLVALRSSRQQQSRRP